MASFLSPLAGLSALQTALPPLKGDTSWIDHPTGMEGLPTADAPARPTSNSTTATQTPATSFPNPIDLTAGTIIPGWDVLANHLPSSVTDMAGKAASAVGGKVVDVVFTSRAIFLIVGLLLIGAGLFQFRATQNVINLGTKAAKLAAT